MGHGKKINYWTWECTKNMGNGNKINHGTSECSKIMGHGNVLKSWDMRKR
jgi:hypothetical protein